MKLKTLLAVALVAMVFASCNRYISTYEAANGKAKCGRSLR
jgi:PBP1b-binding outer membrane lipoprotein LpoB